MAILAVRSCPFNSTLPVSNACRPGHTGSQDVEKACPLPEGPMIASICFGATRPHQRARRARASCCPPCTVYRRLCHSTRAPSLMDLIAGAGRGRNLELGRLHGGSQPQAATHTTLEDLAEPGAISAGLRYFCTASMHGTSHDMNTRDKPVILSSLVLIFSTCMTRSFHGSMKPHTQNMHVRHNI